MIQGTRDVLMAIYVWMYSHSRCDTYIYMYPSWPWEGVRCMTEPRWRGRCPLRFGKLDRRLGCGGKGLSFGLVFRITWFHFVSLGLSRAHLGLTWTHLESLGLIWACLIHLVSLSSTCDHFFSLGFTWARWVWLSWIHLGSLDHAWDKGKGPGSKFGAQISLGNVCARATNAKRRFPGWTHPPTSDITYLPTYICMCISYVYVYVSICICICICTCIWPQRETPNNEVLRIHRRKNHLAEIN